MFDTLAAKITTCDTTKLNTSIRNYPLSPIWIRIDLILCSQPCSVSNSIGTWLRGERWRGDQRRIENMRSSCLGRRTSVQVARCQLCFQQERKRILWSSRGLSGGEMWCFGGWTGRHHDGFGIVRYVLRWRTWVFCKFDAMVFFPAFQSDVWISMSHITDFVHCTRSFLHGQSYIRIH